jgi:hypothetical protein
MAMSTKAQGAPERKLIPPPPPPKSRYVDRLFGARQGHFLNMAFDQELGSGDNVPLEITLSCDSSAIQLVAAEDGRVSIRVKGNLEAKDLASHFRWAADAIDDRDACPALSEKITRTRRFV